MKVIKKLAFKYWMLRAYEAIDKGDRRSACEMALRASDFATAAEHRKELGYLFYGLDWVSHSLGQFQLGMDSDHHRASSAARFRCYDIHERVYEELLESGRLEDASEALDGEHGDARLPFEEDLPRRVWGRIGALQNNPSGERPAPPEASGEGGEQPAHERDTARRVEQSLLSQGASERDGAVERRVTDLRRYRRRREDREMAARLSAEAERAR